MINQTVTLQNGVELPMLGLGVYLSNDALEMEQAVNYALEAGYRSFDTAQFYQNEDLLGASLAKTGFPRKELFLTTKVHNAKQGYESTLRSVEESLENLRTEYLDMLLIHWPGQQKQRCLDTWRAMEELYRAGTVRVIGLSNFMPRHIDWILEGGQIAPAVNQIERHPLHVQSALIAACRARGVAPQAWGPLIRGGFDLPFLKCLAEKYKRTPAQIILRWDVQNGVPVLPKSVHRERIVENAAIFDFDLSSEDMARIDAMDEGHRTSHDPEVFDF